MPIDSSVRMAEPPAKTIKVQVGSSHGDCESWDVKNFGAETWDVDGSKIPLAFVVKVSKVLNEYRFDCWSSSGMTELWRILTDYYAGKKDARSVTEFNELLKTLGTTIASEEDRTIDSALVKFMSEGPYILRDTKPKYRRMTRPLQQQHSTMTNMNTPARGAISETPMRHWQRTPVTNALQSPAITSRAQRSIGFGGSVEVDVQLPNGRRLSALDAKPPSPLKVDSESDDGMVDKSDDEPEVQNEAQSEEDAEEGEEGRVGIWDDLGTESDESWHTSDGGYNMT
jgi:hypothetical protein